MTATLPPDGLLLVAAGELVLVIAGVVDAARRPAEAWTRAGQSKPLWIVLQLLGLVFIIGLAMPAIYFAFIRPSVRRAELVGDR